MTRTRLAAPLLLLVAAGCVAPTPSRDIHLASLDSTAWLVTSAERPSLALAAYAAGTRQLEVALADPGWTASLEQAALPAAEWRDLPPAVILDVDETSLDNGPYELDKLLGRVAPGEASLHAWFREAAALPVPGAVAFTRRAKELGIEVVFLTNRLPEVKEVTFANLAAVGFPVGDTPSRLFCRGELDPTNSPNKSAGRAALARRWRILLLAGDDLNDFVSGAHAPAEARRRVAADHAAFWGTRWILLPNPAYGTWEDGLAGSLVDRDARDRAKVEALSPLAR